MSDPFQGYDFSKNIAPREVTEGRGILAAAGAIRDAARRGLEMAAKDVILPTAKEKAPLLTPDELKRAGHEHRPGELRESARVEMVDADTAAISFNTVYASLQHERMDYHHQVGEAKYLENAMNETRKEQVETIADEIRKVTGG